MSRKASNLSLFEERKMRLGNILIGEQKLQRGDKMLHVAQNNKVMLESPLYAASL